MSVFGSIMSKVLGRTPPSPAASAQSAAAQSAPAQATPSAQAGAASTAAKAAGQAAAGPPPGPSAPQVDVAAVLDGLKTKATQELNWRHSIVDLMKLLSLDSSLATRKELAKELHYPGDTNDSAAMNIWLHKEIMKNLAANGGKLPDDLQRLIS